MDAFFHGLWRALRLRGGPGLSLVSSTRWLGRLVLTLLLALCWQVPAFAAGTVTPSANWCNGGNCSTDPLTAAKAVLLRDGYGGPTAYGDWYNMPLPNGTETSTTWFHTMCHVYDAQGNVSCPVNVTLSNTGGVCPANSTGTTSCTCNSGYHPNGGATACELDNACTGKTGTSKVVNFTLGWLQSAPTSPGVNVWPGAIDFAAAPSSACVDGCMANVGGEAAAWSSTVPSPNGLYRLSSDRVITYGTSTCTMGANDSNNPNKPPASCPGYQGLVNGKMVCVLPVGGGASSPAAAGGNQGNPAAGSDGAGNIGDPARSPPSGSGGNSGGPPAAGDGNPAGSGGGGSGPGGAAAPGTGATGGGSATTGSDGKNTEGGECAKNPSAAGCGGTASGQPNMYTKKTATFGEALNTFKTTIQGSALGTATGGFFAVSAGGTCPTFSAHIPFINADVVIDQFCSQFATDALALFKLALLVVAGIAAFRVAVL